MFERGDERKKKTYSVGMGGREAQWSVKWQGGGELEKWLGLY